jgi:Domain of unknown function (DUF4258)
VPTCNQGYTAVAGCGAYVCLMRHRPLSFSRHALDVIEERQIAREWVQRAVDHPSLALADHDDPDLEHVLTAIPEREGRVLRVVYNRSVDPVRVVTAFFDRTMRGKL